MTQSRNILFIEPYYGGSHAVFADALVQFSRHRIKLLTLPARKWKWRMRGSAFWFTRENCEWLGDLDRGEVDLILCSDMLNVAEFRALLPEPHRSIPIVCYFHENQLTYPISKDDRQDYQFGMTNLSSCLASDAVWFNSKYHRDDFLNAAKALLHQMPDFIPQRVIQEIQNKSSVYYPPVNMDLTDRAIRSEFPTGPLTILWSHRWEYDKNPEPFFEALLKLDQEGYSYELICLGEQFRSAPTVFENAWPMIRKHMIHAGYVPDRKDYFDWLQRCDVVVSTAIQENFGMAVIEAIFAGCQPLLPNRLVYTEIIPGEFHDRCLYASNENLYKRLIDLVKGNGFLGMQERESLQHEMSRRFEAQKCTETIDCAFDSLFRPSPNH